MIFSGNTGLFGKSECKYFSFLWKVKDLMCLCMSIVTAL